MARKHRLATRDSLSNLAASLGGGKDKAANDAFFVADLARDQIESMYRGDWLARKVIDLVPYDSIREWREWSGDRAAVTAIAAAERRFGLRKAVQRAMIMGRLYGGGAIIIGTAEDDPAHLASPLYPETVGLGGVRFLHVVSRWQLIASDLNRDPLDPFFGEPVGYQVVAPGRGELALHPSRVVRFLGNPLPDPLLYGSQLWSDSVLQSLYDAIHAVAVTGAGATSLIHEAKVDIVTVPGLSEHLSNASTTAQLSARFSYAAAMKSINNLLLLGDGETWSRQTIDFGGLPEMVRTFLQVAAGAADIPVTRLLGQSPAGLSATGFTASQIQQSLDLSVDNMNAAGALSSANLTATDILAGRYDDAVVELFWVNWSDTSQGLTIAAGNLGEVTRGGLAFSAEFRSIANRLNETIGTTCERYCAAKLGDSRCTVDLTASAYRATVTAGTAGEVSEITVTGLSSFAADWFTFGTLTFATGANAGLPFDIKSHLRTSGVDILLLWAPTPFSVTPGDTATALAGCRKSLATCKAKFNNVANFRGYPHIPGADVVTRYAVQGALDASGGSLFAGT